MLATIIKDAIGQWRGRVLLLSHVKELLTQVEEKLDLIAGDIDLGIYSAGLNRKEPNHKCVLAGIQSAYQKAKELGRFDLVIVDEAHLKHDGQKVALIIPEECGQPLNKNNLSSLQKALLQGFRFQKCLEGGRIKSVTALARQEHMDRAFLFRALNLVNLAPDIIKLILDGLEPKTLTLNKLRKGFPEDWSEQRKFFGIK